MELKDYVAIIRRRSWIIVATVIVALATTIVGTVAMTPRYTARTTLRIATVISGAEDWVNYAVDYSDRLMNTYLQIAETNTVKQQLSSRFQLNDPPRINVEILANTELMRLEAEHEDPDRAAAIANGLAELLIEWSQGMHVDTAGTETSATVASASNLSVIEPATAPERPSHPRTVLNVALGIIVGLIGGLGLAFATENLDSTVYTQAQAEKIFALPTLGKIAKARQSFALLEDDDARAEAFRRLRASIFAHHRDTQAQTLLFTSGDPGEGKSTTVANLAVAIAQAGQSVVVVDCDMRRPSLHKLFNAFNWKGVSNVLSGKEHLDDVIQKTDSSGVDLLASGPLPSNAYRLLNSSSTGTMLEQLKSKYDFVLIDSPALSAVSDAVIVAPQVDSTIMMVGFAQTSEESAQTAYEQLQTVNANVVGVILNRVAQETSTYHRYRQAEASERLDE